MKITNAQQAAHTADTIDTAVIQLKNEQVSLIDSQSVDQQYSTLLMTYIEQKESQAATLEDKIELLLDNQQAALQRHQSHKPGLFSLPRTKADWDLQQQKIYEAIARLQGRLESVREIKDGMSIHGSKIEDLAVKKLRRDEPDLANDFDEMMTAQRTHATVLRQKVTEAKKRDSQGVSLGRALNDSKA